MVCEFVDVLKEKFEIFDFYCDFFCFFGFQGYVWYVVICVHLFCVGFENLYDVVLIVVRVECWEVLVTEEKGFIVGDFGLMDGVCEFRFVGVGVHVVVLGSVVFLEEELDLKGAQVFFFGVLVGHG